jgi:hypothetical protein
VIASVPYPCFVRFKVGASIARDQVQYETQTLRFGDVSAVMRLRLP